MIKVINFSKKYKGAKDYTTHDISFEVGDGKVLGLLGKNGAGKSTTIKSICGIFPFDKGHIIINGHDIQKDPVGAKRTLGYSPDDHSVYEKLSGRECLEYMGSLYSVDPKKKAELIELYAKKFDIAYALDKQISSYSHGMKQKICLCASLLHQPKLWILDEPMLGLDPQTKAIVMDFIKEYASLGNTVLFSSHDIWTVTKICDYIGVINCGRLVDWIDMSKSKYAQADLLYDHFMKLTEETDKLYLKPAAPAKTAKGKK